MQREHHPVSYQLRIVIEKAATITIGRFGTFTFPAGKYVYTGSESVARHMATSKKMHWHIGYLLLDPHCKIVRVDLFTESGCEVSQRVEGVVPITLWIAPGLCPPCSQYDPGAGFGIGGCIVVI